MSRLFRFRSVAVQNRILILLMNIVVLTVTGYADGGVLLHTLSSSTEESNGQFGVSVSGAMEGSPWVIVGAPREDPGSSPGNAGRAHRFNFGPLHPAPYKSPAETGHGYFGWSVSWAGDVDGDNKADWIVGQPEWSLNQLYGPGHAYIFRSRPRLQSQPLILVSPNQEFGGLFGCSVSDVGDVNGDGRTDVAVGAPHEAWTSVGGRVYVFSGSTGALLHTLTGVGSRGRGDRESYDGGFGCSVSGISDVDGDGKADIVVGAPYFGLGGRAYVFNGATGVLLHILNSGNDEDWGDFGRSVSGIGDVNGDGKGDVVVGAPFEGPFIPDPAPSGDGRVYVFSGATGALLHTLTSGDGEDGGEFGYSVSDAGDVDGDGCPDIVVGARWEDPGSSPSHAGRAYVFRGNSGDLIAALVSPNEEIAGEFGYSVSGAGDVNGDGLGDVIVGARHEDPGSSPSYAGRAYVFSCATGVVLASDMAVAHSANVSATNPCDVRLLWADPNPVHGSTTISYALGSGLGGAQRHVSVRVYDSIGRLVAIPDDRVISEGTYSTNWDLTSCNGGFVQSGVYFLRIEADNPFAHDVSEVVVLR